jgi:hypothetical protein
MLSKTSIDKLVNNIDHDTIKSFSILNGATEVHRVWRDTMIFQGREVSESRMKWETLSKQDKTLDATIAEKVIWDFITWAMSHPHD